MTANPITVARKLSPAKSIEEHCDYLNKMNWVRGSGFRYVIRQRTNAEGEIERFVDRMEVVNQ